MGPVGVQEMIVIFLVALVLFGPKKLPELGKTIGKALTEFRRAQSELKATFDTHMRELERETESVREVTRDVGNQIKQTYFQDTSYDSSYHGAAGQIAEPQPSTAANPSTTGASANEGAEAVPGHELSASGTVPRGAAQPVEPVEVAANGHPAREQHS